MNAETILALERAAMDRWATGDPSGFLEICDPAVTYFDPMQQRRMDGLEALTRYYEGLRGQFRIDRYEMLNPLVEECGGAAVLTYNFVSVTGGKTERWNGTEVYRRRPEGWRIVHTHWSFTAPPAGPSGG